VPIYIYVSDYQLSDKMQEQARFAVVNRYTEDQIRDNIFKVVQELEIPVKRESIKVFNTNAVVKISMEYTVPVDLLSTTWIFIFLRPARIRPSSEVRVPRLPVFDSLPAARQRGTPSFPEYGLARQ